MAAAVATQGDVLIVSGVDLLDNTPIYDIKPYIPYCDCKPQAKGSFSDEFKDYKIDVLYDEKVFLGVEKSVKENIINIISQNPKPAYKQDKKEYKFLFSDYEITFEITGEKAVILKIENV